MFGPQIVDELSRYLQIPKNRMLIACPSSDFAYKLDALGGVRIITHSYRHNLAAAAGGDEEEEEEEKGNSSGSSSNNSSNNSLQRSLNV